MELEAMPEYTTVSVHPDRADGLREFRDRQDLSTLDDALGELLSESGE